MSMGTTDGCKVWYLKTHSTVGANLSLSEGTGLRMLMSSTPCRQDPKACGKDNTTKGAKMASDHLGSTSSFGFGDYELRMRAPRVFQADTCSNGIYAYFTSGFVKTNGKWNEVNFAFDPDRDNNGTTVSCQHHDDTGRYHMTSVNLGFNYRASFNTYVIQLRKDSITWLVGNETVHHVNTTLSQAMTMTTRLIMRTNFKHGDPGFMPDTVWELEHFKFTPIAQQIRSAGVGAEVRPFTNSTT
jgi:beta-glucanase (GH16 family)